MKCENHPVVEAEWRCTACGRSFCAKCVKTFDVRRTSVAVCPVCGEKCEELTQTEEAVIVQEPSFWRSLPGIVSYPLQKDGPIILIAGAIFFAIADFAARWAILIGVLVRLVATGYLCR